MAKARKRGSDKKEWQLEEGRQERGGIDERTNERRRKREYVTGKGKKLLKELAPRKSYRQLDSMD